MRMLENEGWILAVIRGSHRQHTHPTKPGRVTLSGHPGDDIAEGDAGLGQTASRSRARATVRRLQYLVRIDKDPDSDWGASVPDLPGCVATAKTLDRVLRRIQVAVRIHLEGMREDGLVPPRPRQRFVKPEQAHGRVSFYATIEVAA